MLRFMFLPCERFAFVCLIESPDHFLLLSSDVFLSPQHWVLLLLKRNDESATVNQTQGRLWFPSSSRSWIISVVVPED